MIRSENYIDGVLVDVTVLDGTDVVTRDWYGVELTRRPATAEELAPDDSEPTSATAQVDTGAYAAAITAASKATTVSALRAAVLALGASITAA